MWTTIRDTLELLSAALRQRSANVTAVSSAAAAIDSIKLLRPDVLISDIAMPGEDGYELIRKVIALDGCPKIQAIAITAYAKDEDKARALAAGYQRYLSKPVELHDFINAVAEAGANTDGAGLIGAKANCSEPTCRKRIVSFASL